MENDNSQDRLLGVASVAALLDASERTVWRLRAAGKIPAPVKIGGCIRWWHSEIMDYLKSIKRVPPAAGHQKPRKALPNGDTTPKSA